MTKSWIFRADKSQFYKYFEAGTKYPYFKIKMYSTQCKCAYFSLYMFKHLQWKKTKHEILFYSWFTRINLLLTSYLSQHACIKACINYLLYVLNPKPLIILSLKID